MDLLPHVSNVIKSRDSETRDGSVGTEVLLLSSHDTWSGTFLSIPQRFHLSNGKDSSCLIVEINSVYNRSALKNSCHMIILYEVAIIFKIILTG